MIKLGDKMILEAIIISALLVKVTKGSYDNIKNFKLKDLKGNILIILGILTMFASYILISDVVTSKTNFFVYNYKYLHILSITFIALGLSLDYKNPGILIMSVGFFSNLIPIILNGKMPVNHNALLKIAQSTNSIKIQNKVFILENNASLTHGIFRNPKMEVLSDIIPIPAPYYYPKVISIGDILITIGVIVAILYISRRKV